MGWKASAIIIHKPASINNEILLKELGFANLTRIEDEPFEVAINPDDNKIYIGTYNDNLLICAPDIPMHFFEDNQSTTEKMLTKLFPSSEICSIVLHSGVNLWGYSVIQNGQKIRARAGSADNGTIVEIGEPLEEEKDILLKSQMDEDGNRVYFLDDFPDEPLSEDQVGENFVFAICKRYFGEELDKAEDLLFQTTLTGYSCQVSKQIEERKPETKHRRWLPYVLIIMLILIWQVIRRAAK